MAGYELYGLAGAAGLAGLTFAIDGDANLYVIALVAALYCIYQLATAAPAQKPAAVRPQSTKSTKEDLSKPPLTILFGSQTGTAEMFSKNLGRDAKKLGYRVKVGDLLDYDTSELPNEKFVIFVVATYGEGEPTDTMKDFFSWVMDESRVDNPMEDYSGVSFACFGLGDTQYKHFCKMGIEMGRRCLELGMKRVCETGLGDSDKNLEETWDTWRADLWEGAAPLFGIKPRDEFQDPPELTLTVRTHEPLKDSSAALPYPKTASSLPPTQKVPCWAVMTRCDELLTGEHEGRSTRHIEFDVSQSSLASEQGGRYEGGDHLGILSANADETVEQYASLLGLSSERMEDVVSLVSKDGISRRNHLPSRVPVRVALKWFFDLQGPPKKSTLRAFTHYTADSGERQAFQDLLRNNDQAVVEYRQLAGKLRTVGGFLQRFPSTKVPLDAFFELMPRIAPRWYSIASDSIWEAHRKSIHICIALTQGGLCSSFLNRVQVGERVPCFVRKSTFHLPQRDKKRPAIMIGPGTGVAPLIGFLYRRKAWLHKGEELGPVNFYFGCRSKAEDWLYRDLMQDCKETGVVTDLRCAFSRDQAHKVYVQHLVDEDGARIYELIEKGANIYICGDAKHMARDVEATLIKILMQYGSMDKEAAERRLSEKERRSEYLKDVWTT